MSDQNREVTLEALIRGDMPVPEARMRLGRFPWDSDTELVKLTRHDLVRIIDRYLSGSIDGSDVEQCAEAIEGRDDVGYETGAADRLRQLVFELANPDLGVLLDPFARRGAEGRDRGRLGDPPRGRSMQPLLALPFRGAMSGPLRLTIVFEDAGDGWIMASIPQIRGVFSQGRTRAEARENVIDALQLMLTPDPDEQTSPDREPLELLLADDCPRSGGSAQVFRVWPSMRRFG